jgi:hypothetical protein
LGKALETLVVEKIYRLHLKFALRAALTPQNLTTYISITTEDNQLVWKHLESPYKTVQL